MRFRFTRSRSCGAAPWFSIPPFRYAGWAAVCVLLLGAGFAFAQEKKEELPPDVARAVRDGMAETLEAKFKGGRNAEEVHLIAQAYANRARRARTASERAAALDKAEAQYRRWIEQLGRRLGGVPDARAVVALAQAGVEYAGVLMGLRVANELDEFELTAGQRGDRAVLRTALEAALQLYDETSLIVDPLHAQLFAREDEFLAAGLYDPIANLKLDIAFNRGWANYYLALIEENEKARTEHLRAAERNFRELLDTGQAGQMLYQCHLGLGMVQRELKDYDAAERSIGRALQEDTDPAVAAQARCELARCHMASGKFNEARTVLAPLLRQEPDDTQQRAERYYLNLAHLLDAYSYLREADALDAQSADSVARAALARQAERARQTGIAKFNRLTRRGGSWPALVQLYIAASVDLKADPAELSPAELLYSARLLSEGGKHNEALQRLLAALARPQYQPGAERDEDARQIGSQLLLEQGRVYYRLDRLREAAETFDRLAREYRGQDVAPQAATFAYQLWAEAARKSKAPADYAKLAEVLLNLLQSFPDHPERKEAEWLLPVSLQAAEQYEQAAAEFEKLGRAGRRAEEARFRALLCRRMALEATQSALADGEFAQQAERLGREFTSYAGKLAAQLREADRTASRELAPFAAEAQVNAAELLSLDQVAEHEAALETLRDFEAQFPESELIGRVLSTRIRAYRGLRQFAQAGRMLERYLQNVSPEQAGVVLASLARGMQQEVAALQAQGQAERAKALAAESLQTFEQLENWLRKEPKRADQLPAVSFGRAEMLLTAGQAEEAERVARELLQDAPQNGAFQHLLARSLTAQLGENAPAEARTAAQEAWGALLADPNIRQRAPERFWEARYHWLAQHLALGKAEEVDQAIKQEQIWYPDLGGPPWKDKLLELRRQAREQLGVGADAP